MSKEPNHSAGATAASNLPPAFVQLYNLMTADFYPQCIYAVAKLGIADLLAEAGVNWVSQEQISKEWPEVNEPLKGSIPSEAQSSTWQSLAREQGTVETDFLNGEVVRLAASIGRKAPINEKLLDITLEMAANRDHPGKYSAEELSGMLGLK